MKHFTVRLLVALLTFTLGIIAATVFVYHRLQPIHEAPSQAISQPTTAPPAQKKQITYPEVNSIREIDFANFTYPGSTFEGEYQDAYPEEVFTIHNGKYGDWRDGLTLTSVSYGDVTGDSREEAIVNFSEDTDGSAAQNCVYIFTLEDRKPKLLWAFESGDRSEGGLRRVYAKRGELVVELFGKEATVGHTSSSEFTGMCCPKSFTRSRYRWIDGEFQEQDDIEVLPNPAAKSNCSTCLPKKDKLTSR